jgi:hypothetical protein
MGLRFEEEQAMPPEQRIAALEAEIEARLSALQGGEPSERHVGAIKWCAAMVWCLKHPGKGVAPGGAL